MGDDSGGSSLKVKENVAGLLCYSFGWISGLVIYLLERKSRFVRFHAVQSLVTFGALSIVTLLFRRVPVLGGIVAAAAGIAGAGAWIIGMLRAYRGEVVKFPFFGRVAERRALTD